MAIVYDTAEKRRDLAALANGEVRKSANKIKRRAEALADVDTGAYKSAFAVEADGDLDYLVVNNDSASVPIELGHTTKSGKHVPGKHTLARAVNG